MYSTRSRMARAKARIKRSLSADAIFGSPKITDFPPPWGKPAAAFFKVMGVVDVAQLDSHIAAEKGRYLDTLIEDSVRCSREYLKGVAQTFPDANVRFAVEKGGAAEVIIAKAGADNETLITMATHAKAPERSSRS